MKYKHQDIEVLKKIYKKVNDFDWSALSKSEPEYKLIDYPVEAEKLDNVYIAKVKKGLSVITGIYVARYYYEEDKYTWERKYFASLIGNEKNNLSSISFITDEDYTDSIIENNMTSNILFRTKKTSNIIVDLYDTVNRIILNVDDLYSEFLDENE